MNRSVSVTTMPSSTFVPYLNVMNSGIFFLDVILTIFLRGRREMTIAIPFCLGISRRIYRHVSVTSRWLKPEIRHWLRYKHNICEVSVVAIGARMWFTTSCVKSMEKMADPVQLLLHYTPLTVLQANESLIRMPPRCLGHGTRPKFIRSDLYLYCMIWLKAGLKGQRKSKTWLATYHCDSR